MADIVVNINQFVRFRLKPKGVECVRSFFQKLRLKPEDYFPGLGVDREYRKQFHEVMEIFGGNNISGDVEGCGICSNMIVEVHDATQLEAARAYAIEAAERLRRLGRAEAAESIKAAIAADAGVTKVAV